MEPDHPLRQLDGRPLGDGQVLRLASLRRTPRSGWRAFELELERDGATCRPPVAQGLYSAGGRGVTPWIELDAYRPQVDCAGRPAELAATGADRALFGLLAGLLPPGGHLMLGCEGPAHRDDYLALCRGVPPAATRLGRLLLESGLLRVKFFALPEGGWEGQKKLWAEKPPDAAIARAWAEGTARELATFLGEAAADDPARAGAAAAARTVEAELSAL